MNALAPFTLDPLGARLATLASSGVYIGTSSWKYPGWLGGVYTRDRYIWRGRFSNARFERLCLTEYAEVFRTVCVDAAYYAFPTASGMDQLAALVPDGFRFAFKVTGDLTVKRFPTLARFGQRAGHANANFLNADMFVQMFLKPCAELGSKLGLMMFEFSQFSAGDFSTDHPFVERLDGFLGQLPKGFRYGVEIRNPEFLRTPYLAMLARHGVAHIYNSWEAMPSVARQIQQVEGAPAAPFLGARFLLKPGRAYADAVKRFSPYDQLKEPYPEGVEAGARLARKGLHSKGKQPTFIYVNNRFEGNAPQTIRRMLDQVEGQG
jgi:uncharacterized protein YecE (DUF72 family)